MRTGKSNGEPTTTQFKKKSSLTSNRPGSSQVVGKLCSRISQENIKTRRLIDSAAKIIFNFTQSFRYCDFAL